MLGEWLDLFQDTLLDAASGWWTLLAVFAVTCFDGVVPIFPSDTVVVGLGTMLGEAGVPAWYWVVPTAGLGALLGDFTAYRIGRSIGTERFRWMRRPAPQRALAWARHELDKRGALVIFVGRFIPGARVSINYVAGATRYSQRRFLVIDGVASHVWAGYSLAVGHIGSTLFDSLVVAVVVAVTFAVVVGWVFDLIFRAVTVWLDRRGVAIDPEGYLDTSAIEVERPIRLRRRDRSDGQDDGGAGR
ncbi:MAG: DedA family protein [Nesterenkonia sp.]|uniref:DedA family protein n=1 Tax=Nesterenkonia marinintestina TaxID=2979865 RepID=UPI0021C0C62A|nr:DedA family protein [Nesterenkonia sp. GX14115]MDO5493623.1 DedA family protein [Nesterenkonia sp.]